MSQSTTCYLSDDTDAGYYRLDVENIGCDFLSISSHKIHGPKGVGALFVRDPSVLSAIIPGGDSQEFGLRGGTENVAGIVGFGEACEITKKNISDIRRHIDMCREAFISQLDDELSPVGRNLFHINGNAGKVLNVRFDGIDGQTLLLYLDSQGICVSTGSACNGHDSKPSRVLLAFGLSEREASESIRISFSSDNTVDECCTAARIVAEYVNNIAKV